MHGVDGPDSSWAFLIFAVVLLVLFYFYKLGA